LAGPVPKPQVARFEPKGAFAQLIWEWEAEMSERKITQLFGLALGALFTFTLVLNAFAY